MGYFGLRSALDSDTGAEVVLEMCAAMAEILDDEMYRSANEWNTCGLVNVGNIFREIICPAKRFFINSNKIIKLACKLERKLAKLVAKTEKKRWDDRNNKRKHLRHYRDMLEKVRNFLTYVESK